MTNLQFMTDEAFRKAAQTGHVPDEAAVRKSLAGSIEKQSESRILRFTISTGDVDRAGDTVSVAGWDLKAYMRNPVVLWGHQAGSLPIARAKRVWAEGDKLKADAEFMPADLNAESDRIFRMLVGGWLRAVSVGFRPLKWKWSEEPARKFGIDFQEAELVEFSVVTVPANSNALLDAPISAGKAAEQEVERLRLLKQTLELESLR